MSNIFIRIIIAVVAVILLFALIPPVLTILGTPQSEALGTIFRIAIGGGALLWIIYGSLNPPAAHP
jgi:uncharacterized protein with PQ loop repeat